MFADMRTDGDEYRIEATSIALGEHVGDLVVEHDADTHLLDARDFRQQVRAWQAIGGDAEVQHPAGHRASFVYLHLMAETGQMVSGGQTARASADDQDALTGSDRDRNLPALSRR